jgi:NinG protein
MKTKFKICKQCGQPFKPFNSLQPVCSPKCAVDFNSKKEVDKRVKVMRKESKSLSELKALARQVFQTWVRMRDKDLPCISSGVTTCTQWDASHYFKAEVFTGLIFEPMNCNKQRSYDNQYLDGNLIEYRKGMIAKYGEAAVESLEARANLSRVKKYTREHYQEIISVYRSKIKELRTASRNAGEPVAEFIKK